MDELIFFEDLSYLCLLHRHTRDTKSSTVLATSEFIHADTIRLHLTSFAQFEELQFQHRP